MGRKMTITVELVDSTTGVWECPFCGEHCQWPTEAVGHLIGEHSAYTTDDSQHTRLTYDSLILPDIGDEQDIEGRRLLYRCPFCEVPPDFRAAFPDKADLKQHLEDNHGAVA